MKLLKTIYNFLGYTGRNRAAAYLARRGDHIGAQRIMMIEFK